MVSSNPATASCRQIDNTMRVWAGSCRGGFDFTLLFEETILQILPIALILILVPFRIIQLSNKRRKVVDSWLLLLKLVSSFAFIFFLFLRLDKAVRSETCHLQKDIALTRSIFCIPRSLGLFFLGFKSPKLPYGLSLLPMQPRLRFQQTQSWPLVRCASRLSHMLSTHDLSDPLSF